jgi:hypothetical protein
MILSCDYQEVECVTYAANYESSPSCKISLPASATIKVKYFIWKPTYVQSEVNW